jgi:hypothetical protein
VIVAIAVTVTVVIMSTVVTEKESLKKDLTQNRNGCRRDVCESRRVQCGCVGVWVCGCDVSVGVVWVCGCGFVCRCGCGWCVAALDVVWSRCDGCVWVWV